MKKQLRFKSWYDLNKYIEKYGKKLNIGDEIIFEDHYEGGEPCERKLAVSIIEEDRRAVEPIVEDTLSYLRSIKRMRLSMKNPRKNNKYLPIIKEEKRYYQPYDEELKNYLSNCASEEECLKKKITFWTK